MQRLLFQKAPAEDYLRMASSIGQHPIRVLVTESRRMWGELLAATLRQDPRFAPVVAEALYEQYADHVASVRPDIVLVGVEGDEPDGPAFEMLRSAHEAIPDLKSVMLLETANGESIREAFLAGARGVVNRSDSAEVLMECVCCVFQGRIWARTDQFSCFLDLLSPYSAPREAAPEGLTRREMELVDCVSQGMTNREIAVQLNLSEHTVRNYLFRIFRKFGVSNRAELVGSAMQSRRNETANVFES